MTKPMPRRWRYREALLQEAPPKRFSDQRGSKARAVRVAETRSRFAAALLALGRTKAVRLPDGARSRWTFTTASGRCTSGAGRRLHSCK